MEEQNPAKVKLRPMTKSELAAHYKVSLKTLKKWLEPFSKDIGPYRGRCYTVKQIKIIFDKLGD